MERCPICTNKPLEERGGVVSWIECGVCGQWYHTRCVGLGQPDIASIHSYHCSRCEPQHGPSTLRRKSKRARVQIDYVALNDGEQFAVDKSAHPHVASLLSYEPDNNNPYEVQHQTSLTNVSCNPIVVRNADLQKVDMHFPFDPAALTLDYITKEVGADAPIEVMDVLSQQGVVPAWSMGQWRDYFNEEPQNRDRIRNVISLEISQVDGLGKEFVRPRMVRELDLVDKVWPRDDAQPRPQVTAYCLMSVAGSFTDFHIDFGGTSVYYTVCSGSKTFLMFPPTHDNLALYQSWCNEQNQNFMWFCDYSKTVRGKKVSPSHGIRVTLSAGDLFIIPSGWIHAVYTPQDSIVIGGNFLTMKDMVTQLEIARIEKETRVPAKFRFPMFNKVLWLASWYYVNHPYEYQRAVSEESEKTVSEAGENISNERIARAKLAAAKDFNEMAASAKKNGDKLASEESNCVPKKEDPDDILAHKTPDEKVTKTETNGGNSIPKQEGLDDQTRVRADPWHALVEHLWAHYELSKSNPTAKRSIPVDLIGKDVAQYLSNLSQSRPGGHREGSKPNPLD